MPSRACRGCTLQPSNIASLLCPHKLQPCGTLQHNHGQHGSDRRVTTRWTHSPAAFTFTPGPALHQKGHPQPARRTFHSTARFAQCQGTSMAAAGHPQACRACRPQHGSTGARPEPAHRLGEWITSLHPACHDEHTGRHANAQHRRYALACGCCPRLWRLTQLRTPRPLGASY